MKRAMKTNCKKTASKVVALSLSIATTMMFTGAYAGPGDVNSVNDGQNVQGGTYYNTAGDKTTFINSGGGGLWIKSGTNVRGLEVSDPANAAGSLTGNGGHLHFYAPSSVVRVDGNINVSGLAGSGYTTANGGRVTVDAAFYYQNGNISAFGNNGGVVQFNVGSALIGPDAQIDVRGLNGAGGQLNIQATDAVSFQSDGSRVPIINTSGQVIGSFDSNIINIEGALVNLDGTILANGLTVDTVQSNGGTVRLIASGGSSNGVNTLIASSDITSAEAPDIINHLNDLTANNDGDVITSGSISTKGSTGPDNIDGGKGGTVYMQASDDIYQNATIIANGGRGGYGRNGSNPGTGGAGGTVLLNATNNIEVNQKIDANGGNGGSNRNTLSLNNTNNGFHIGGNEYATIADASDRKGGTGGQGGFIGFKYGDTMKRNASIYAIGGNGGQGATAIARDTHNAPPQTTAYAKAIATGGQGGQGGQGGTVVFDGSSNPIGNRGTVRATGGNGGTGGSATARSYAFSFENANGNLKETSTAWAFATGGTAGEAGRGGSIIANNPAALNSKYWIRSGIEGNTGRATAESISIGVRTADAIARATGRSGSSSEAIAIDIRRNNDVIPDTTQVIRDLGANNTNVFKKTGAEISAILNNEAPAFRNEVVTATNGQDTSSRNIGGDAVDAWTDLTIIPRNTTTVNNGGFGSNPLETPINDIIENQQTPDFTINEPVDLPITSGSGTTSTITLDPDLLALFQEDRANNLQIDQTRTETFSNPLIGLQQPGLFFTSTYRPVTQEILRSAGNEYSFQIAEGKLPDEAFRLTVAYLVQAGVDASVADSLLNSEESSFTMTETVRKALEVIYNQHV